MVLSGISCVLVGLSMLYQVNSDYLISNLVWLALFAGTFLPLLKEYTILIHYDKIGIVKY